MAEVSKETTTVVTETYHIALTKEEAEVLRVILSIVGGAPWGARGVAYKIAQGLRDCGVEWRDSLSDKAKGSLYFTD